MTGLDINPLNFCMQICRVWFYGAPKTTTITFLFENRTSEFYKRKLIFTS